MPLNINNLTSGTPVTFNAQTSVQRMVFDSSTVAFRIVNNTPGIVTVMEENSDSFICQVDPGATAFGLMQNAILVEAQYSGPVTLTPYTWIPVSSGNTNTWTAQNIFKSPSATVAGAVFQSSGTVSSIPAGYGGSNIVAQFIAEESSAFPYTLYDATGNANGHILAFRQSRGTYASRTATQLNDFLGVFNFGGHNGTDLVDGKVRIRAIANQNWTTVSNGTSLEFLVTPSGQNISTLGLRLSAGTLLSGHNAEFFGTIFLKNNTGINFESVAAVSESVLSITSANNVQLISPTASGNILITNRSTSGQVQLAAGTSTGVITLATGGATRLTISSSGLATFSNQLIASDVQLNNSAGTTRTLFFRTAGSTRWTLQASSETESGSNAGSNFHLRRYSDTQVDLGLALSIDRATGVTTLNANKVNLSTAITGITASGSAGTAGDIAWDDTYLYVRMSTGWRRIALGAAF